MELLHLLWDRLFSFSTPLLKCITFPHRCLLLFGMALVVHTDIALSWLKYLAKCHPDVFIVVFIFIIAAITPLLCCHHHHHPVQLSAPPLIVVVQHFGAQGMVERINGDR